MKQIDKILETLEKEQNYRRFIPQKHQGLWIATQKSLLFNCASNDYLNLACDEELKSEFLSSRLYRENLYLSASSSRSLSGNFLIFGEFYLLLEWYVSYDLEYQNRLIIFFVFYMPLILLYLLI